MVRFIVSSSGITVIALVTVFLKSKGYLNMLIQVIFMIWQNLCLVLVFWTYLWFSQFMLIWYANTEEITYFITRIEMYNLPFSVPLL
jgi:hypothetical protein